jgi:dienelactone hydrolase
MTTMAMVASIRGSWLVRTARCGLFGVLFGVVAAMAHAEGVSTEAGPDGPAQIAYAPASGKGPIVVVISGQTGPNSYQAYAAELAKLGYYTVLLDGKDILNPALTGPAALKTAIERAQRSPAAAPGKAAVIGFSLGGGGALYNAAPMPELVSMVVAYYPYTRTWVDKVGFFVKRFRVPVLVMAAQRDRYQNCCLVETAQAMEAAAKEAGVKFELVVYPEADHGFNLESGARGEPMRAYRRDDDRDAWRRTLEMLQQYQPLTQ